MLVISHQNWSDLYLSVITKCFVLTAFFLPLNNKYIYNMKTFIIITTFIKIKVELTTEMCRPRARRLTAKTTYDKQKEDDKKETNKDDITNQES